MAATIFEKVKGFKTVVWDWNGTIINDCHIAALAETQLFNKYGIPTQTPEERIKNFSFPIEGYYKKMGFDFSKHPYDIIANEWLRFYEQLIQDAQIFMGMNDTLNKLKNLASRQFILSAAPESHVKEMTLKHSIHGFFDGIYGLANARAESKINRGHELLREHSIDPSTTIIVGDTVHDFEVAQALGASALLIADGHHSYETLAQAHHNVLKTRFDK